MLILCNSTNLATAQKTRKTKAMFTIEQIKAAHAQVKTGADFPKYIQSIKQLGVSSYDTFVADGHAVFRNSDGNKVVWEPKYSPMAIAIQSDRDAFKKKLQEHQQGHSDYPTFCDHAAECGVEKWTVDLKAMTCTYYDRVGEEVLMEDIITEA